LAPGDDFHAEGEADARDLSADIAQAQHAQHLAVEFAADRCLPATLADGIPLAEMWRAPARMSAQVISMVGVDR
jgi:hypothetical protein